MRPTVNGITIEPILTMPHIQEVENLQAQVWGFGARGVVPTHVLYTVATSGGILLGAYDGDTLIGFVFGFLGAKDGRPRHVSHMLGIHPAHQGRGVGEALKQRQREVALEQGLDLMTWTYDPLESRNAYFNLHKLGATSRTYYENLYGDLGDELNRGLPTDRLLVEWSLRELRAGDAPGSASPVPLLEIGGEGPILHVRPDADATLVEAPALSAAIPPNTQQIKKDDPAAALEWRLAVRAALSWAFAHGFRARDFTRGAYILTP
jgi:predicted GNAT superfamily acetyltransferase